MAPRQIDKSDEGALVDLTFSLIKVLVPVILWLEWPINRNADVFCLLRPEFLRVALSIHRGLLAIILPILWPWEPPVKDTP